MAPFLYGEEENLMRYYISDYKPLTLDEWIEVDAKRRKELGEEL